MLALKKKKLDKNKLRKDRALSALRNRRKVGLRSILSARVRQALSGQGSRRRSRRIIRRRKILFRFDRGFFVPYKGGMRGYNIYKRSQKITQKHLYKTFGIFNGARYYYVRIVRDMLGHSFGEFSPTKQWKGSMIHRGNKIEVKIKKKTDAQKAKKKGKGRNKGSVKGSSGKSKSSQKGKTVKKSLKK